MPKKYRVASFGNEVPSLHHTDEDVSFFSWLSFLLVSCVFFLQKPIGIIALLDEAWYNLFALWIGVHLYIALANYIQSWICLLSACFQNQRTKHSQPSCFSTSCPTLGLERRSFQKQILLFLIMLERLFSVAVLSLVWQSVSCNVISSDIFMQVTYHTDTFLDKNRDYVVLEHCNVLSSSKCPFVSSLFPSLPEESSRSSYKFSSVASRFKVYISITFWVLLNLRWFIIANKFA